MRVNRMWRGAATLIGTAALLVCAPQAMAGGIQGLVTDSSGTPVKGVFVSTSFPHASGGTITRSARTGVDGRYALQGVDAGPRVVKFDGSALNYVPEFYDDAATANAATPVPTPASGWVRAVDAQLTVGAKAVGTVTDAQSRPLDRVTVRVGPVWALTDARGRYTVTGIRPGSQIVRFEREGQVLEYWQDAPDEAGATPVSFTSGATSGPLDAQLQWLGRLLGVVRRDSATGPGLGGGTVTLTGPVTRTVSVSSDGSWSSGQIWPGEYTIAATPPPGVNYLPTTVPGTHTVTGGTDHTIGAIVLQRGALVRGRVTNGGGASVPGAVVTVFDLAGDPVSSGTTGADGKYSAGAIPTGDYKVRFAPPSGSPLATEWFSDQPTFAAAQVVRLTAGQARTIDAQLIPG